MRLTEEEKNAIVKTIHSVDPEATIYLFGSRVDDTKKGGDIDLFVDSTQITLGDKIDIRIKLYDLIGEQKIDIVTPKKDNEAFIKLIRKKAVKL